MDVVDESVLEDCLPNGDDNGSTESLEELYAGRGLRNELRRKNVLDDDDGRLKTDPSASPHNDLIAEPFAEGCVETESVISPGPAVSKAVSKRITG